MTIHQEMRMYAGPYDAGEHAELALAGGRLAWVHGLPGSALVNGHRVVAGDALL